MSYMNLKLEDATIQKIDIVKSKMNFKNRDETVEYILSLLNTEKLEIGGNEK